MLIASQVLYAIWPGRNRFEKRPFLGAWESPRWADHVTVLARLVSAQPLAHGWPVFSAWVLVVTSHEDSNTSWTDRPMRPWRCFRLTVCHLLRHVEYSAGPEESQGSTVKRDSQDALVQIDSRRASLHSRFPSRTWSTTVCGCVSCEAFPRHATRYYRQPSSKL